MDKKQAIETVKQAVVSAKLGSGGDVCHSSYKEGLIEAAVSCPSLSADDIAQHLKGIPAEQANELRTRWDAWQEAAKHLGH